MHKLVANLAILALALLTSCAPEAPSDPAGGYRVKAASSAPDWRQGDSLSVLDNAGNHPFVLQSSGRESAISGKAYAKASRRIVFSPFTKGMMFNVNALQFTVPALQDDFRPASVALGAGPLYEMDLVTSELSFTLAEPAAWVKVTALGGESLSGAGVISFDSSGRPSEVSAGNEASASVTLLPAAGEEVVPAGRCRLVCLPCQVAGGLEFMVWRPDGSFFKTQLDGPLTLLRGETAEAGEVAVSSPSSFDEGPSFDLDLIFITNPGTASLVWPFSSPASSAVSSTATNGRASFQGVETEFLLPGDGVSYSFKAFCTKGIVKNSSNGFCMMGQEDDYLELPVMPGYLLSSVTLVTGYASTAFKVTCADGTPVTGGSVTSTFPTGGGSYTWQLYGAEKDVQYRLSLAGSSGYIQQLKLHYASVARPITDERVSPLDMGLNDALTGEERYNILYQAHVKALSIGKDVDYSGVGTVDIVIPENASSIPLTRHTDFCGAVFNVRNDSKDLYMFRMTSSKKSVTVTGAQIDAADYRSIPELSRGMRLLAIEDQNLWVANRQGYDYGATRREAVLVRDGVGSNGPCASYDTEATNHLAWYCVTDDEQKSFCNITLNRDRACTHKTYLVRFEMQNNVYLSNITVNTPVGNDISLIGDSTVGLIFCTNILMEDCVFEGNYSKSDEYGYSISCNATWNATFRRLRSNCPWAVFGCNNTHASTIEDSVIERFDTHCYGRDITMKGCHLRGKGLPASSIFGDIILEDCFFENCYLYTMRPDYNAYVDFNLSVKNCEITPKGTGGLISMGRLDDQINSRPELEKKRWPNVSIDGLTVNVPSGCTKVPLYYIGSNTYGQPVGHLSDVSVKGLKFKYVSQSAATASFWISSTPVSAAGPFRFSFSGSSLKPSASSAGAKVYVNIHGTSDTVEVNDSEVQTVNN